jgi:hypothetical protein
MLKTEKPATPFRSKSKCSVAGSILFPLGSGRWGKTLRSCLTTNPHLPTPYKCKALSRNFVRRVQTGANPASFLLFPSRTSPSPTLKKAVTLTGPGVTTPRSGFPIRDYKAPTNRVTVRPCPKLGLKRRPQDRGPSSKVLRLSDFLEVRRSVVMQMKNEERCLALTELVAT